MVMIVDGVVVTFQTDLPTLEWSELKSQLLIELIFLRVVKTTILHLKNLITMHIMSVWVIDRVGRPATGNIMEEKTGHVRRAAIVLTYPFRVIGNCEPVLQSCSHLTGEVVTCELVLSMANETALVKNSTTKIIVHIASTAAEGNIMLTGRNSGLIHLLEPVGICPRTCVHTPRLIGRVT